MTIGKTPDVWAAAVKEYGIINWFTTTKPENRIDGARRPWSGSIVI
ncbi:MAG TPA: hypothetical protein VJ833_05800 [Rhodanobacteraceae bacterium]|nr:hypothetical protein [Rhodanobacteraceae bacterium]